MALRMAGLMALQRCSGCKRRRRKRNALRRSIGYVWRRRRGGRRRRRNARLVGLPLRLPGALHPVLRRVRHPPGRSASLSQPGRAFSWRWRCVCARRFSPRRALSRRGVAWSSSSSRTSCRGPPRTSVSSARARGARACTSADAFSTASSRGSWHRPETSPQETAEAAARSTARHSRTRTFWRSTAARACSPWRIRARTPTIRSSSSSFRPSRT
mmetsp:Transcript_9275/g.29444  ORF Transcript_9275/g.29444 Transcript_9275/m.29444 type:complete len:214 (+) Transcript_9275:46-687(+)